MGNETLDLLTRLVSMPDSPVNALRYGRDEGEGWSVGFVTDEGDGSGGFDQYASGESIEEAVEAGARRSGLLP